MKNAKKLIALLLALAMVIALFPTVAFAEGGIGREKLNVEDRPPVTGCIHVDLPGGRAVTNAYLERQARGADETNGTGETLPSRYDSRDYGYITPVRNQGFYGTCWAFGTIASIEAYMIKHGIVDQATGEPATTAIDLSEYHLAWFAYTNAYDKLGLLNGDSTFAIGENFLDRGGTKHMACYTVMRWEGPGSESTSALAYSNASANGLNSAYAYNHDVAHVTDSIWIPVANRDAVKRAIMEHGAGTLSFYCNELMNYSTRAFCYKQEPVPETVETNHAVAVVGWDDNYSRSNFNSRYGPSDDGAWIIKNSWGSSSGDRGYFYLSYEDTASLKGLCFFYKVAPADNYSNCYQYDGTSNAFSYVSLGNNCQVANIYTAAASENLTAVAINLFDEATSYTVSIYKNPGSTPTSGTLMSSQTGYIDFAGYYTIPLKTPVPLSSGDKFAVVFTLNTPYYSDGGYVHMPYDASYTISWAKFVHANHGNTSYYKNANGNWTDVPNNGDFRIKAYTGGTSAPSYTVTARSNNTSWGTVSVDGNVITAKPANGYYVSDVRVSSGTATFKTEGNTITVTPSSNCTIDVIFAAKPTYYIQYVACGENQGTASAKAGDPITLPTSVNTTPIDWTFCGWVSSPVEETSSEPTYYAPGATYTVTGNTTLYALYSRTEGNSELCFRLLTATPDTWEGNYVITYTANAGSMRVLKGAMTGSVTNISTSTYAPMLSGTGITLNQDMLTNVSSVYQFHIFPYGSSYRIQNLGTGSYIGGTTTLYAITDRYTNFLSWTLAMSNGAAQMKNTYKGNYLNYNTAGYFNESSSVNSTILLWKEAPIGTTYYSTEFAPVNHVHSVQYVPAVAPTCTEAGQKVYYYCDSESCTLFGQKFADEALTVELTNLSVPALGHNPGQPVKENVVAAACTEAGGYDMVTRCQRCNEILESEHFTTNPLGHSYGAWETKTAPTCTEPGEEHRICTLCGAEEARATDALGHVPGEATEENRTEPTATTDGSYDVVVYCTRCHSELSREHFVLFEVEFSVPECVPSIAPMICSAGDAIDLPIAEAPEGYSFLGWVSTAVNATEAAPSEILTDICSPSGSMTLYALYSYTANGTASGFELLTEAPDTWEGNYVITYTANPDTMHILKGVTTSFAYMSTVAGAPTLADTGATLKQNLLTNVDPVYQFTFTAHGESYWIQNVSFASYVGATNAALYAVTERSANFLNWSISFQNGMPQLCNLYKGCILTFGGGLFRMSSAANTAVCLWKEVPAEVTYYTTFG